METSQRPRTACTEPSSTIAELYYSTLYQSHTKTYQPYRITVKRKFMKIEFVGGISPELADVIEKNGIDAVCVEGNICEISDKDFLALKSAAPAAFDGNDIVVVEDESTLEQELIKTGFRYSDNEDGTYDVCYDHSQDSFFGFNRHHVATVKEDAARWYVDNNCGLGWGEYSKADWTLMDAISDQCIDEHIS